MVQAAHVGGTDVHGRALAHNEASDAFEELMGDRVEPRREFIERNALSVQDLDI